MLEVLRKSPVLHLGGGKTVTLHNIRPPAKTLSLSAEALVDATAAGQSPSIMDAVDEAEEQSGLKLPLSRKPVAIVFGPENGAVAERQVFEAAKEASAKGYTVLYVIGFAIQANARELIESCEDVVGVPAAYVQATPDLMMGDLLKNMRSSQIFSVCGLPEIAVSAINARSGVPAERRYTGGIAGPRRVRPADDGGVAPPRGRRAGVVPGHRLQRPLLPRQPGVLPAHRGVGQPQARAQGHVRGQRVGAPGRHGQRAVRGRASIGRWRSR